MCLLITLCDPEVRGLVPQALHTEKLEGRPQSSHTVLDAEGAAAPWRGGAEENAAARISLQKIHARTGALLYAHTPRRNKKLTLGARSSVS